MTHFQTLNSVDDTYTYIDPENIFASGQTIGSNYASIGGVQHPKPIPVEAETETPTKSGRCNRPVIAVVTVVFIVLLAAVIALLVAFVFNEEATLKTVDGQWGSWQSWGGCSATCDGGERSRTRQCDSPPPQHDGQYCVGPSSEKSICGDELCPGTWANWGDWGECSFTCGSGARTRNRTCDGKFSGEECGIPPTFKEIDTEGCVVSNPCPETFCGDRNASCSYKYPNRCDLFITCDAGKVVHMFTCNALMRYRENADDKCQGICDWEDNVQC